MAIRREGQANVSVAEPFADHLGMHAGCHQESGMTVPEPMEWDARHSGSRRQLDEAMIDVGVVERRADGRRNRQVIVVP